jgi:hypothetical protein
VITLLLRLTAPPSLVREAKPFAVLASAGKPREVFDDLFSPATFPLILLTILLGLFLLD